MSLRDYTVTGPAGAPRALAAAWLDLLAGGLLAMLVFPFPIVRAALTEANPDAWLPPFVACVLGAFALGGVAYLVVTAAVLGRTPGMYLTDLGFEERRPQLGRALAWALATLPAAVGGLVMRALADPGTGLAARLSGARAGSTAPPAA